MREPLESYLRTGNDTRIRGHMLGNSCLPGPRGNLELAAAFADAAHRVQPQDRSRLWQLCDAWASISPDEAPPNNPKEFLVFCGTRGFGGVARGSPGYIDRALARLHGLARDPRWRTREAVAMALQDLLRSRRDRVLVSIASWIRPSAWLEMRAVAAGLADPPLLQDGVTARAALELHRKILREVEQAEDRLTGGFKVLRQGLGFTLSVVVVARPKEGFPWLESLASAKDRDVLWIVKENLKKKRLVDASPGDVKRLEARLRGAEPPRR
jgi:hypothetical protein